MEDVAHLDFETRGTRKLGNVGVHSYVEDPWFRPTCLGWAINNDPVQLWKWGQKPPQDLVRHIERGGRLEAWHAMFERICWKARMHLQGWPLPSYEQWNCVMVRSYMVGYPGALRWAAVAMKLDHQKDMIGSRAMNKLSKPRSYKIDGTPIWWREEEVPDTYTALYNYCIQDVETERAASHKLPYLTPDEEEQYHYDQMVADRGVHVDLELCRHAMHVASVRRAELDRTCLQVAGFRPSQVGGVTQWIKRQKYDIDNLQKLTVDRAIKDPHVPRNVYVMLKARQEAGKTSTAKYETALECVCADGTLKGQRQFYGSHTGRWAGRLVQLDNLMRPTMADIDMEDLVTAIKTREGWLIESAFDNGVMEPVANAQRGMLVAPAGEDLYVGDYKSIESRVCAYIAGQKSKLDAWRASDEGRAPDVYVVNAARMFNCSLKEAAHKDKRFWGKTAELLLQYEGSTNPLLRQQVQTDIRFREIYDVMHGNASPDTRQKVDWMWGVRGAASIRDKPGVEEKDWKAARYVVEQWRADNPNVVNFWRLMKNASVAAVRNPGEKRAANGILFEFDKETGLLKMHLLSGRPLYYPGAHVELIGGEATLRAYYMNAYHVWGRYSPYGGFFTENATQALARDVMASSFPGLEKHGYKLRHTVHDELITSAKKGSSLPAFVAIATTVPIWMHGLPLALDAWCGPRYRKKD